MTLDQFRIEPLEEHDRTMFDCGQDALNDYFRKRVSQDVRRNFAACYVAVHKTSGNVAAYYTLSAAGVSIGELPEGMAKRLPRYPTAPVVRIGRLAVDQQYRGHKLGSVMLYDAIKRTHASGIGAYAILVDAKDEGAVAFYEHHGFMRFESAPMTLFLPISKGLQNLM